MNQGLIDLGNNPNWPSGTGFGHTRVLGAWNDYGGTGGYDLTVHLVDVPQQRNEVAHVQGVTMGMAQVNTGDILQQNVSLLTSYVQVTGYIAASAGDLPCHVTIVVREGDIYSTHTIVVECDDTPNMQKGPVHLAAAGCGGPPPGGDVGVVVPKSVVTTAYRLGFAPGSLEYQWMSNALNWGRVEELKAFLDQHKLGLLEVAPEAKFFGREAVHGWMSNDFSSLYSLDVFNQNPYGVWKTLTQAEKGLIKNFPMQAYRIFKNRKIAENETIARFGHNGLNDKSDAFRHAFFNVINSIEVGQYTAKLFSDAHESEVPQRWAKEKQMDLFNNNVGHNSISGNSMKSENELADIIYQKLLNGDLRYLSPINLSDLNFAYTHGLSNSTTLIPTDQ